MYIEHVHVYSLYLVKLIIRLYLDHISFVCKIFISCMLSLTRLLQKIDNAYYVYLSDITSNVYRHENGLII